MARKSDAQIRKDLEDKLTRKSVGAEIFGAVFATLISIALVYLALAVTGVLAFLAWVVFAIQVFGVLMRIAGWKTVVLTNDEQAYLAKHF